MDQIPDHVLIEIFNYFGCSSLKTLMNVCVRWSNLIKTSRKVTKKFNLTLTNSANGVIKIDDPLPDGSHSDLVIISKDSQNKSNPDFMKVLSENVENHKNSLQKLNLRGCYYVHAEVIEQKLSLFCDFIKEDEITDCMVSNNENLKELKWRNLRSLRIDKSCADFMLFFQNSQLQKLELSSAKNTLDTNSKLATFWKNQTKLKEFKITKTEIPLDILLDVLGHHNLSRLELDIKMISLNSDLIIELAKDSHWKKLSFLNGPCREKACMTVKNIIAAHPCIDELEFHKTSFNESDFVMTHIYNHLPHIQHLRLPLNYGSLRFNEVIAFEKLEVLEIEGIKYRLSVQKLFEILKMSRNLKVLKIYWVGHHARVSNDFFKNIFETLENLQELHIGYKTDTFEITDEFLDVIKINGKNLKKLTTYSDKVENLQDKMRIFDGSKVKCVVLDKNYEDMMDHKASFFKCNEFKTAATCVWSS
ncbi:hypothetical protein ACKWTF_014756 [Chironomus riparius]